MKNANCPVCGSKKVSGYLETQNRRFSNKNIKRFKYFYCLSCGSLFLSEISYDKKYYENAYGSNYYKIDKSAKTYFEKIYSRFVNFQKWKILRSLILSRKKIKVLDVGAGNIGFLNANEDYIYKKSAIDIYKGNKVKKGIDVINSEFIKYNFGNKNFDIVTSWHVIEHIPDPKRFLSKIRSILNPGGYAVISTPNLKSFGFNKFKENWYHLDAPRHIVLFNREALRKLAEEAGFTFIREINMFYEFPFDIFHSVNLMWKILLFPIYPFIKLVSSETITFILQKQ